MAAREGRPTETTCEASRMFMGRKLIFSVMRMNRTPMLDMILFL
jgi:hypothetical protein